MLATRWKTHPMNWFQNELGRLIDHWSGFRQYASGFPQLNVWEDDDHLYVEAELPGFSIEDIEITAHHTNQLRIVGERVPPEMSGGSWHSRERGFGKFERTLQLPSEFNADGVSACLKDGVLRITMARLEEARPRKINVTVG